MYTKIYFIQRKSVFTSYARGLAHL